MTRGDDEVWNVVGDEVHRNGRTLLTVNEWLTDEDADEVCRLASAAPMMLRALEEAERLLVQTLGWREGWECSEDDLLGGIRSSIKAAKGEDYDE